MIALFMLFLNPRGMAHCLGPSYEEPGQEDHSRLNGLILDFNLGGIERELDVKITTGGLCYATCELTVIPSIIPTTVQGRAHQHPKLAMRKVEMMANTMAPIPSSGR